MEAALFGGTLMGVAATNALELGIDVGSLDVTLHLGFPGARTARQRQRAWSAAAHCTCMAGLACRAHAHADTGMCIGLNSFWCP